MKIPTGTLNDFLGAMTEDDARPRHCAVLTDGGRVARNASGWHRTRQPQEVSQDAGTSP
ncbi:hypothetical protein ECP03052938_1726 [Escherichia coli p0305293.8]|nr:hypothetical protein ECP03052938_1726 [Escherichia coli p0305293.8]